MAKMKSKYILYGCSLIVLMIVAFSCSKDVNLDNPLDPNVQLSSPDKLQITYMKETTLQLSWNKNCKQINDEQAGHIFTLLEQSTDGNTFVVKDTIKGSVSTATLSEEFVANTTYYFRIRTMADSKTSGYSNVVSSQESSSYAPSNLIANGFSETKRSLSWQDNSSSETGFIIKRKLGGTGNYSIIGQVPANTTAFTDSSVIITDTTYYYSVSAVFGNNMFSSEDTLGVTISFPIPDGLKINNVSGTSVKLSWNDYYWYQEGFIIERHERGGEYSVLAKVASNITAYIDSHVDSTKDYFYRIRAFTKNNYSKYSNEIKIGYIPGNSSENLINNIYWYGKVQSSRDGKYMLFCGWFLNDPSYSSGHFKLYNNGNRQFENSGYHGTNIQSSTIGNDDKTIATFSNDSTIKIWKTSRVSSVLSIPCMMTINHMIFSSDDSRLICSATDNRIYCWNVDDGTLLYVTDAFTGTISCLKLGADGENVACVHGSNVDLINPLSGNISFSFPVFSSTINTITFSRSNLLAVMHGENTIDIWDCTSKTKKCTINNFSTSWPKMFFTNDNSYLGACVNSGGNIFVWRLSDSQLVNQWSGEGPEDFCQYSGTNVLFYDNNTGGEGIYYRVINYSWSLLNN